MSAERQRLCFFFALWHVSHRTAMGFRGVVAVCIGCVTDLVSKSVYLTVCRRSVGNTLTGRCPLLLMVGCHCFTPKFIRYTDSQQCWLSSMSMHFDVEVGTHYDDVWSRMLVQVSSATKSIGNVSQQRPGIGFPKQVLENGTNLEVQDKGT